VEQRLRVFENRVQIDQLKKNESAGHVAHIGERRGACSVWTGKPEEKRPLGKPELVWLLTGTSDRVLRMW